MLSRKVQKANFADNLDFQHVDMIEQKDLLILIAISFN